MVPINAVRDNLLKGPPKMHFKKFCTIKWLIIISLALLVLLIGVSVLAFVGFPKIIISEIHKVSKNPKIVSVFHNNLISHMN